MNTNRGGKIIKKSRGRSHTQVRLVVPGRTAVRGDGGGGHPGTSDVMTMFFL